MWEHFYVSSVLLEDFTLEVQVRRNLVQIFIPFCALTLISLPNSILVTLHLSCLI